MKTPKPTPTLAPTLARPLAALLLAALAPAVAAQVPEHDPRFIQDPREIADPRVAPDPRLELRDPRLLPETPRERFELHLSSDSDDRLANEMRRFPGEIHPWIATRLDQRHGLAVRGEQRTEQERANQSTLESEAREMAALADLVLRDTRMGQWVERELAWGPAEIEQSQGIALLVKQAELRASSQGWEDTAFRTLGDFRKGLEAARLLEDERRLTRIELDMARVFLDEGRPLDAQPYLDAAARRARELFDAQSLQKALQGRYDAAAIRNDVGAALVALDAQIQLADRMNDVERSLQLRQRRQDLGTTLTFRVKGNQGPIKKPGALKPPFR